jgi:Post-segregation antitoxin CcdA
MKPAHDRGARQRPVHLMLNEDRVNRARGIAVTLSGVAESLLADYAAQEQRERLAKSKAISATVATWDEVADEHVSVADDQGTRCSRNSAFTGTADGKRARSRSWSTNSRLFNGC